MVEKCPCGSGPLFTDCCGEFIEGKRKAPTAEVLMRSRYSAYVVGAVDYILNTTHPKTRGEHDRASIAAWADQSEWRGLEVHHTEAGGADDSTGTVLFTAHFKQAGKILKHKELSFFERLKGRWFFLSGVVDPS